MNTVPVRKRFQWKQWLAALIASCPMLGIDFHLMWSTDIQFFETSPWLLLKPILLIIGAIIGAVLADNFGRRASLIMISILVIPGLPVCFIFTNLKLYIKNLSVGFFLLGTGARCVLVLLYISEISSSNNRRNLMLIQLLVHCFWLSIAGCTSRLVHQYPNASCITFILLFGYSMILHVIIIFVYPETPGYLNWKKRYDEAAKSLNFFSVIDRTGPSQDPFNPAVNSTTNLNEEQKWCERIRESLKFENLKNLGMIFFFLTIRRASGQDQLFTVGLHSGFFDYQASIYSMVAASLFVLTFIFGIILMLKIDVFAQKVYLLWIIFVNFIAVVIGAIVTRYFWAMVPVIYVQYICHAIFIAVTLAYVGELFPIKIRSIAIVAVLSYEVLMRSLYSLIFIEPGIINYPYSTPAQRYFGCGVLLTAFFFALKYFPKTNLVAPCSDIIARETFAGKECVPIEELSPHSETNIKFTASNVMCYA